MNRVINTFCLIFVAIALCLLPSAGAIAKNNIDSTRMTQFQHAADEFGVPLNVLLAMSYNQTRWENHKGQQSIDGGFGLMDLTTETTPQLHGRDGTTTPKVSASKISTLDKAASLLHVSADMLKTDDQTNIRGGAAVLADNARHLNSGSLPTSTSDWDTAVAKSSGFNDAISAQGFVDDVFDTIKTGQTRATTDGQLLSMGALTIGKGHVSIDSLHLPPAQSDKAQGQPGVDCPAELHCRFVPAAYALNDPKDPTSYGNYDSAQRPNDVKIDHIIIHDTEGSYNSAISLFQDQASFVSAHYVIRSSDGAITQMVPTNDIAWHAGNWHTNMHSIGIEHEGFEADGGTWYTEAMYKASAKLVRHLAQEYDIPMDREHIIGHENVPGPNPANVANMHTDPGPFWDWDHYMDLINDNNGMTFEISNLFNFVNTPNKVVTIAPRFGDNQPPITHCIKDVCTSLPPQPSNIVYVHQSPHDSSPLLSDTVLHPDGKPGTTNIADTSATVMSGQRFVIAQQQGEWIGIWYGGRVGWLKNPQYQKTAHLSAPPMLIAAKKDSSSIPVYGRAYPEANAYPSTIPVQPVVPLPYTIPAGQKYVAEAQCIEGDYYYAATIGSTLPDDHTTVSGKDIYYQISYNHRQAYVKASDVDVTK